ncbi:hypothetical protein [Lactobacillus sp. Sy-1]|uniref:hypothetical protein n=1 Tax=Lactobacillus sp. Sy-1 TaxID=2109645 RepID=UPI001C58DEAA|nr:hypothetical protein [Lactobacillus sp. Sy-1]MBW1605183.1 hypothetical protein [Lactobacillus sp. Sy-1]
MGSEANQINSSANNTLSAASSAALAGFSGVDSQYGVAAKNSIDAIVKSMAVDIQNTDVSQTPIVESLTSKSVSLINSAAQQVVLEYAKAAISNSVKIANNRAQELDDVAKSSATVAISYFAGSAYGEASNYATPSEATSGVNAFTAAINSAINNANFSSANVVVTKAAESLTSKTNLMQSTAAEKASQAIETTANQVINAIKTQAADINAADSLAQSGVEQLESLASESVLTSANAAVEDAYHRFKNDLVQVSDAVAKDALAAIEDVLAPVYDQIESNVAEPLSASADASNAISSMSRIFTSYGNNLVSAGVKEYTSSAYATVGYLNDDDLLTANSMISSVADDVLSSADSINTSAADAVNRFYGLIPYASQSIKSIADEVNIHYAASALSTESANAGVRVHQVSTDLKSTFASAVSSYTDQVQSQVRGLASRPDMLQNTLYSASNEIDAMANSAIASDPYASACASVDTAYSEANDQLNLLSSDAIWNASSAVNVAIKDAYLAADANRNDQAQLNQIGEKIYSTVSQVIHSYATSAAFSQLAGASAAANSMIEQLSNVADQKSAADRLSQIHDDAKRAVEVAPNIHLTAKSGVSTIESVAADLISTDPTVSAYYAVQNTLSSAAAKGVYLDQFSHDNATSEVTRVANSASSAINEDIGNANALSKDVDQASLAADEIINRYNVNSAQSAMNELASSAKHDMRNIADDTVSFQASSAVTSIRVSLTATLNRASDRLSTISLAMSSANSSIDSITARYVGADIAAAAYSKVDSVVAAATSAAAEFDESNQGNADSEVAKQLDSTYKELATTRDHNGVASQASQTIYSVLNRYTLSYTSVAFSSATSSAQSELDSYGVLDGDATNQIHQYIQSASENIKKDARLSDVVLLDLRNGLSAVDSYVNHLISSNSNASAIRAVESYATELVADRSAANFDFANFSSAVTKTTATNCSTIRAVEDKATIDQLVDVTGTENTEHFKSNVADSAITAVSLVADDVRTKLTQASLTADSTINQLVDKYVTLIKKDAEESKFADLDSKNGIRALKRLFATTVNDHPKVAQVYRIDSLVSSANSMAVNYISDSADVALSRDLYRAASSAKLTINSADNDLQVSNAADDANNTINSIVNSHIAASALETIESATMVSIDDVADIKNSGKLIDAQNEIHSMAQDGFDLIRADEAKPTVVNTDVRNTINNLNSMAQAAIGDDSTAAALSQVHSMANSAKSSVSLENSSAALNFDSSVAKLVNQSTNVITSDKGESLIAPELTTLKQDLDQLADRFKLDSVNAKITDAADNAKLQFDMLRGADKLTLISQLDALVDGSEELFKTDLNSPAALKTDINNVLFSLREFVDATISNNRFATAKYDLNSALSSADSTAAKLSGSIAANLNSDIASADHEFSEQLSFADDDNVQSAASSAVNALGTTVNNYVATYANEMINNAAAKLFASARTYQGINRTALENNFNTILEKATNTIQSDSSDISLAVLDAKNAINALYNEFRDVVTANGESKYQYTLNNLKRSAVAAAGSMDSFTAANMASALNSTAIAASGHSNVASAQMSSVVNAYHASNAQSEVVAAATAAHRQVLQLSNVTKISTSAAINNVVASTSSEINADVQEAKFTSLDAKDGIVAINKILDSAIADDFRASTNSFAASATSAAFNRLGSLDSHTSLVASNQIQQIVDRAASNNQAPRSLAHEINQVANEYLIQSATSAVSAAADSVRDQLKTNSDRSTIISEIKKIVDDTNQKVRVDVENPAYLSLDIDNGIAALNGLVAEFQDDKVAAISAEINSSASDLNQIVTADELAKTNISSAAASVARIAAKNIANVISDSNAVAAFTNSAANQFDDIRRSYFASSANNTIESAVVSAKSHAAVIADPNNLDRINAQFSGVAESFKQLVSSDAISSSLASLDADNAVLEINRIASQAVDDSPVASTKYAVSSAVSAAFSNATLMTRSQSDNYESAMAKVVAPIDSINSQASSGLGSLVDSVMSGLSSVANQYYGQWATSAVSQAADDLFTAAGHYNGDVASEAASLATKYQSEFSSQFERDYSDADLIVLDAQNAVKSINSAASEAAYNDSIAFANAAISDQISSANSVLTQLNGHTDSTADMQMDSVANQANEKLGSVYSNLNAVMMVINSASGAMNDIANFVIVSSAHSAVGSVADSLMVRAVELTDGDKQSTLISSVKNTVDTLDNTIDAHSNYPVSVSMAAESGMHSLADSMFEEFKQNRSASAEIALQSLASSAATQVGDLDSFASANFSSAVGSISRRTNAYLADQFNSPKRVESEIKYAGKAIKKLIQNAIADSANASVDSEAALIKEQLPTIADEELRSSVTSEVDEHLTKAQFMIKSDAFDYQLASLDAYNTGVSINSIASSAFRADSTAAQSLANRSALYSAHAKIGSLSGLQSVTFDSQIADLNTSKPAEYQRELDSIASEFIKDSAETKLNTTLASASVRANVVSDTTSKNNLIQAITQRAEQASMAIQIDAQNAKFASLDANNATSTISSMVNEAIERDSVASASVMIQKAADSVIARMGSLASDQQIRFNKQVDGITSNANTSLIGPFADKNNVISQASTQIENLANAYLLSSAYSAVDELASSASVQTADLSVNDSLSVKTYIDSALSSADSQISAHSASDSLIADAVNDANNTVENLASAAVNNSPMAAAKHSLASVRSSATVIASSLSGRNAANFSSAIASVNVQAIDSFTADDATANQQALQSAAQLMRNISNFHAAKGALGQIMDAASAAETKINRMADDDKRNTALTDIANTIDEYRLRIQNDTDNLKLINLDVINGQNELANVANNAIKADEVAKALADLDSHANTVASGAANFSSLASANLSSAVNDLTSTAVNDMVSVKNDPAAIKGVQESAEQKINQLFNSYVTDSAVSELDSMRAQLKHRIGDIQVASVANEINTHLNAFQSSVASQVAKDAHSKAFVDLDLRNANSYMNSFADSNVQRDVIASAAYDIQGLITAANSRAQHLSGSAADNFSSAINSVSRQATHAASGVSDYRTLDTIISATDKEVSSTVGNYLVASAYAKLSTVTSEASAAMNYVDGQTKMDANKAVNSVANSAAQLIHGDSTDDQLISLDVKEGIQAITSITNSVVASQPFASAHSVVAHTASVAMQRVGSLSSFASANLSSAMNRFKNEAHASMTSFGADEAAIDSVQNEFVESINDVANSYVASSASELITHATDSAYNVINQFNNSEATSTANETIDNTLNTVADNFAKDSNNASLMALDAANAIDSIRSAAQFITTTDEVISGNVSVRSAADSAYSATAGLGRPTQLNKQIKTVIADTTGRFANGEDVDMVVKNANRDINKYVSEFVNTTAEIKLTQLIGEAQTRLGRLLDGTEYNFAVDRIKEFTNNARKTIQKDAYSGELITLDLVNIERELSALENKIISENRLATALNAVDNHASAAVNNPYLSTADDHYLNFSSAVNSVVRDFDADDDQVETNNAFSQIDSLSQSYAASQAVNFLSVQISNLDTQVRDLSNFVTQSSAYSAIHEIASQAVINIRSDNADFGAVSLDADNAISSANAILASAVSNDSIAAAKRNVSSVYSEAASFATRLSWNDSVEFSMAIASQDAKTSFGTDANNASLEVATESFVRSLANSYVASYANSSISDTASKAIADLRNISDSEAKSTYVGTIKNVVREITNTIASDTASQDLVNIDVQNGINMINSLADSMVRNDPTAAGQYIIASAASSAFDGMASGNALDEANFTSAINSVAAQASLSVSLVSKNLGLVNRAATSSTNKMNRLAVNYRNSLAQASLSSVFTSASATVDYFSNEQTRNSVMAEINSANEYFSSLISADAYSADYVDLDLENGISKINRTVDSSADFDTAVKIRLQLASTADQASFRLSSLSSSVSANFTSAAQKVTSQTNGIISYANSDVNLVSAATSSTTTTLLSLADSYMASSATSAIDSIVATTKDHSLNLFANADVRQMILSRIQELQSAGYTTIERDSADDDLLALDVRNVEARISAAVAKAVNNDVYASANYHVQSVSSSLIAANQVEDPVEVARLKLEINSAAKKAKTDISGAGMNNDLIHVTVDSTSSLMSSIAQSFTVKAARNQVSSYVDSANSALSWFSSNDDYRARVAVGVNSLAAQVNNQIERYASDENARKLMTKNGQKSLANYVDTLVHQEPQASASYAVAGFASSATSAVASISGSSQANFNSEVAMTARSADEMNGSIVDDSETAEKLTNSVADAFDQVARKYVADGGYTALDTITSSAYDVFYQFGLNEDQFEGPLQDFAREYNSMVDSDAAKQSTVLLDCHNASLEMSRLIEDIAADDLNAYSKWQVQSGADSIVNSLGTISNASSAANFSSAMNSLVTSANVAIDNGHDDESQVNQEVTAANTALQNLANSYVVDSAKNKVAQAQSSASALVSQFDVADQLTSVANAYTEMVNQDSANSAFASLDADNGSLALASFAKQTISKSSQAELNYQVNSAANTMASAAAQFASDDQVRFSSAIASVVSAAGMVRLVDERHLNQVVTSASQQMHSVANYFIGKTAMSEIDVATTSASQRVALLHNDAANVVMSSAAASANSAVIAYSSNPLATSLYAHDGVIAANSLADSLIAEHPFASAIDRVNQLVDSATHDVLMSDSLADMNFLSAVAKQSKYATEQFSAAATNDSELNSLANQAEIAITSVANSYVMDSAGVVLSSATSSAASVVNEITNNVERSQAINWINNQASVASELIATDVNNDSLVSLDLDNAIISIGSVANSATEHDAQITFNNYITSAFDSANSQASELSGSLAENYDSAVNSANKSIRAEHQSGAELDYESIDSATSLFASIAADYVTRSSIQMIEDKIASLNATASLGTEFNNQLAFVKSISEQTIRNDSYDVKLATLDAVNAVNAIQKQFDNLVASNQSLLFHHQLTSQASSASEKVGTMNSHSAANFSSAASRIANNAINQANTFGQSDAVVASAASAMNSLANGYILNSAMTSLNSIVDSANVKIATVDNYVIVENAINSAATETSAAIINDSNDSAVVSLRVADMRSHAQYLVDNAISSDRTASAMNTIYQIADSLMSDAELTGHAQASFASVTASTASSASYDLLGQSNIINTINNAKQTLKQAANRFVVETANEIVNKALDIANNQAVEIYDIHNRNKTISAIGAQVSHARQLIKEHANNPFFAYLDAQNAAAKIATITSAAVGSDTIATAILSTSRAADRVVKKLRPLIDENEEFRLNNRLLNIVDQTNRSINVNAEDSAAVSSHATAAESAFNSIASSYVAESANSIVTAASDSATIQIEGLDDTESRNETSQFISLLVDSASSAIDSDASNIAYASLDATNASSAITSLTAQAINADPSASANATISKQIASTADTLSGMKTSDRNAFSSAVLSVVVSANVQFASAASDASAISNITDQTLTQLDSVAREFVVTSAKAVVNGAASAATHLLDSMFANSSANVYSSVASVVNQAIVAVNSDSSNFATVSLDAYNASSAIDQLVKTNENSYAHSAIDSQASYANSLADVLNDALRPVAVNGISLHASAAHSAVNLHFGQAQATLSDVNSAARAMDSLINEYVVKDPVASAHSIVASAASSANVKAANLNDSYLADMSTSISSAATQANTLIAMNPANSLLDSQLASDAASSMNSFVNMYEAAAANEATTSYAASAYAQIDLMDDEFKQLANHEVAMEVDNAKQAFSVNEDDPRAIFDNVQSAADNMKFLVANYIAKNSNAVVEAKQSFAADMDSLAGDVYSQARVLSINNRGQINSLTGSVANSASASVSGATTISNVASTFHSANALIGSVASVAINFARDTARAELANVLHDADQSLNSMEPSAKQAVTASIDALMSGVQGRITIANNTVEIVNETQSLVNQVHEMVTSALSANLRNIKDSYKTQILNAATTAYQDVNGLDSNAQSLTNAAISMAASDANANIDQTNQLAEIQMLTSAGIASINEASSVAVSNVKASGNSLIASAANSATGRTATLSPVDKSTATSIITSLASVANMDLNTAANVEEASVAITSGAAAIASAIDSTIASVINSAMAMANNLAAQNERDSIRLQVKSAANAAYASTASLDSSAASAVNEYVTRTASIADRQIIAAENEEEVNEIARSGVAALQSATNSAAGIYVSSLRTSAESMVDSAANSAFMLTDAFNEATRYSMNRAIAQIADGTKFELRGASDADRANQLISLTVDNLNKLIDENNYSQLDGNRAAAKTKVSENAQSVIGSLGSMSAISKQTITKAINEEVNSLYSRINKSHTAVEIKNVVDSSKPKFESKITMVNSREMELSRQAAKQVLKENSRNAYTKVANLSEMIVDTAEETIDDLIERAYKDIDVALTVDKVTEITNRTSGDINNIVKESISMNDKMK